MKRILLCLLVILNVAAKAQVYNNEWIDHSKTYYKFKIDSSTGLRRISGAALATIGLENTPAEHFQLWRNGVQVPIYTSVATGILSASDYLEFWGEMNDGKPDRELYRKPEFLLNDKWSLETDSATYFLTVNPAGNNLRLTNTANNITGNTLPAETYFMYTTGKYFRDRLHGGYAVNVDNTYLYSSAYDKGEGWASTDIVTTATTSGVNYGTHSFTFNNLFVSSTGPSPKFKVTVSGNAVTTREYKVAINADSVVGNHVDFFNYSTDSSNFNLSTISSGTATVVVTNKAGVTCFQNPNGTTSCQVDRLVIHQYELTYPRQFNFAGASNFEFKLPASSSGNYLEISGFSFGATPPALYDLTNGKRYIADISAAPLVRIVLGPSATERRLVLATLEPSKLKPVNIFKQRTFTNYSLTQNQGNYLIISNPILFNGANGTNPVEDYRAYRASSAGGSHDAKIYLVDELIDQFAFGIKAHPAGIRNFIQFAKNTFSKAPKNVLLIGKGVNYVEQRNSESHVLMEKLDLVPTFGSPASDNLLSSAPGSAVIDVPIGRISAINAAEVAVYLEKLKQMESGQATMSPKISDKAWMKNVVHVVGADAELGKTLNSYMNTYRDFIMDSLFGGTVYSFSKQTASAVEILSSKFLENLFAEGISILTYFGHSGSTVLSYNIQEPSVYNNVGKYPLFVALGCNAGSMFSFTTSRTGLSEMYVLAPQKGTIGFLASSHYGIVYYMDVWNSLFYKKIGRENYGQPVGEAMKSTAIDVFKVFNQEDFYLRSTIEQMQLHGDPAFKIITHPKPDYVIEDQMVKVSPSISVSNSSFTVQAKFMNIGKAESKPIVIEIKRKLPDQSTSIVFRDTITGIRYADSINVNIPIDPLKDKGTNVLTISIDADNSVDEIYEINNSINKEIVIFDNEAKLIYPYNHAIINQPTTRLAFSTSNPLSTSRDYKIEIDTTELFNSSLKLSRIIKSVGGVIEIDAGIPLTNNTVYYWRVAPTPDSGDYVWNTASFIFLENHELGFNQSHLYQHLKSTTSGLYLDSATKMWRPAKSKLTNINAVIGTFPTAVERYQTVFVNSESYIRSTCWFSSLVFNVFDEKTTSPWFNTTTAGSGLYGSLSNDCSDGRLRNFEFRYADTSSRRKMMDFMEKTVPDGAYVLVRNMTLEDYWGFPKAYPSDWASDSAYYGPGKSLYHYLKKAGFAEIDSFNRVRQWAFIYKKNDPSFEPRWVFTQGAYDFASLSVDIPGLDSVGYITSPAFGPAKKWKQFLWDGSSLDNPLSDEVKIEIQGVKSDNSVETVMENIKIGQNSVDISSIDASVYPYLQLKLKSTDSIKNTPYQLGYWRLTNDPAPEGAVAPNIYFKMTDTLAVGQPIDFKLAFKNVTQFPFDSLKIKMIITDQNNVQHVLPIAKVRPLQGNDTIHVQYSIDTKSLQGSNILYVEVNPDNDQPEQYHFNNFIYTKFFVIKDSLNPLMDVTFDNVHILNNDIVSPKPNILIKIKDESKWMLLTDTSLLTLKIKYPNGRIQDFHFNSDTLNFIPAQSSSDNTAQINFKPYFAEDGSYELIISATDASGNETGDTYKIGFQVINKPMISNMLNYPNPFTTSTAFVFTLTGSEVPQNIRIQILTVTGKIVREITTTELGPLRIGRNITEYKWDGTDQYGQKLANGVYLYRVITNLNGKALEKYKTDKDDTDKYFNKGYGKMYLMR